MSTSLNDTALDRAVALAIAIRSRLRILLAQKGTLGLAMQRAQKITLGEMRESGLTRLIVYCGDCRCAHSVLIDAGRWGDDVRLSDLEPKFTRQACRHRGSDIRPLFEQARMGT
ncbi:hypothetical protein [Bradyrhizobium sp. sBnM-33]|uniref:hypothetical protein n=1 Tax=Bradyrhizobium sp. sBnM-33 TaxID=2831780 RepID=UPI0020BEE7A7|nr:hypothetical protein [Bradyrhizobium sp. sBnM-33]WOH47447.1 hypothetical protein RX328_25020 [Bradyrhizobium sp. sBnM-33]